ncbi:MAG TPA: aconitate hydratase AcnA [Candidatus Krumholzibacteria bacterium]|nr:aconitate hydratase AcnA [Candidatus Krumholzibacteria bacterium]
MTASRDTFRTRATLDVAGKKYAYYSLQKLEAAGFPIAHLPYSLRILLENLLRCEDGRSVQPGDIEALSRWRPGTASEREIAFMPARVILQDFTGVPAVVDLAAMRDALAALGGDPRQINPSLPSELVIDHSIQVDAFGTPQALQVNARHEYARNRERYAFLRWGQGAFDNFRVVPPNTGIVHQVNLEYLARVVFTQETAEGVLAYPDSVLGTDSHTTMINGLGVLGWGVGGIEAEAAMLGQPVTMLVPPVLGFELRGEMPEGATATDLVLTVAQMLRRKGVVGKFVEFYGDGLDALTLADRATIANMTPEFGSTCGMFPIDAKTLDYLRLTGRSADQIALVEAYAKEQGLFRSASASAPEYSERMDLDLATVVPTLAGPRRPHDRVALADVKGQFAAALPEMLPAARGAAAARATATEAAPSPRVQALLDGEEFELGHGSVVIAAITSCTNTSNPAVLMAAGLLAKKAVARGLRVKPWVKTSLAPGSKVVTDYLNAAGLMPALEALRFHVVGYGCTTCIGNSGPVPEPVAHAIEDGRLVAVAVLSGNRNFEGRINPLVRANYLASPPLVVAYALAGRIDVDLQREPLGQDAGGRDVHLRDIWPSNAEIQAAVQSALSPAMFTRQYADVYTGDDNWRAIQAPEGVRFTWDPASTYVRRPTFFDAMPRDPVPPTDIENAQVLAMLGDSVTTDHISPAGSIPKDMPAARYLLEHGVRFEDFNSFGARRGNHEVMIRGTFGNVRLRNELAPGTEGGWTRHFPDGTVSTIYDAAMRYIAHRVPLLVIAGKEYGSGSSRDWAAKGTALLGVRAVIAESFERIHRSNLIGMGVLPLQFADGETRHSLDLTGEEIYSIRGIARDLLPGKRLDVVALSAAADDPPKQFSVVCRIDTPLELEYYRHGGILQYVLRQML